MTAKIAKAKIPAARRAILRREAHEAAARFIRQTLADEEGAARSATDEERWLVAEVERIAANLEKKSRLDALMSSEKQTWRSPESFLELVRAVAPIGLDPFGPGVKGARLDIDPARKENALRIDWFTWRGPDDGAALPPADPVRAGAGELIYCNPEYGRKLDRFMSAICAVGQAARDRGIGVLALVPARTDPEWARDFMLPPASDAIAFMHGRLTFEGAPSAAPFPSAVPFWGPPAMVARFYEVFKPHAEVWLSGDLDIPHPHNRPPPARHDWPPRGVDGEPIA